MDMNKYIITLMQRTVESALEHIDTSSAKGDILIVPAPSSWNSIKRRGMLQTEILAKAALDLLISKGYHAEISKVLKQKNKRKQVNFSGEERSENKRKSIRTTRASKKLYGRSALIVDDICTTGATLNECIRTLRGANIAVIGVLSLTHA
jgi:predicted amidophosphoribosyltransferase